MDWKTHMMVPLFIYIAITLVFRFDILYSVQALFLLLFAAFLPDIDHPRSLVRKVAFILVFYIMVFAVTVDVSIDMLLKFAIITCMLVLARYAYKHLPIKHRGKHSLHLWRYCLVLPSIFAFAFIVASINISLILFIIVGYGSHLAVDRIDKF